MKKLLLMLIILVVVKNSYAQETHYLTAIGGIIPDGSSIENAFSPAEFNDQNNWSDAIADDNLIGPGDTVILSGIDGPLKDNTPGDNIYSVLQVRGSGESGNPITITADQTNPPIIYGAEPIHTWGWEKIDFMPGTAHPWDMAVMSNGPVTTSIEGVPNEEFTYNYAVKLLDVNHTEMKIELDILPYVDCIDPSQLTVLSLRDSTGPEIAWVEVQCTKIAEFQVDYDLRYTVKNDDNSTSSTGWQTLGSSGPLPVDGLSIYYKQGNGTGEAYMEIDHSPYLVENSGTLDNDEQTFDRVLAGAINYQGNPSQWLLLYNIMFIGDGDEGVNIYRTEKRPAMLWDTNGTDCSVNYNNCSDDVDLAENPTLGNLGDTETGWWFKGINTDTEQDYEYYYTYLKLPDGEDPNSETCTIEGTIARGIYVYGYDKPPEYRFSHITIDGGDNKITLEKCGNTRHIIHWLYTSGGLVAAFRPMDNYNIGNCKINRTIGDAIRIGHGGDTCTVHNNEIDLSLPVWGKYGSAGAGISVPDISIGEGNAAFHPVNFDVYDNLVSRCHYPGIYFGGGSNIKIHDNYLYGLPEPRPDDGSPWVDYCQGTNIHIEIENCGDECVTGELDGLEIYNNRILDTGKGIVLTNCCEAEGDERKLQNVTIYNNILDNVLYKGSQGAFYIGGAQNVYIYNNDIVSPTGDGLVLGKGVNKEDEDEYILIKNNIISNPGGYLINSINSISGREVEFESDYNCLHDEDEWRCSINGSPNLVNYCFLCEKCVLPGCSDYHPCDDPCLLWSSIDQNGGTSSYESGFQGEKSVYKFHTPSNGSIAGRQRVSSEVDGDCTVELTIYFDSLGTVAGSDYFDVLLDNGVMQTSLAFTSEGLMVHDGTSYQNVYSTVEAQEWHVWRFVVNGSDPNNATLDVYKDDSIVADDVSCDYADTIDPGLVKLIQNGGSYEMSAYLDEFSVRKNISSWDDWQLTGNDAHSQFADPLFADPDGLDDILGTEDDDLHIQRGSPCIDTGTNYDAPPDDIDGEQRTDGAVDIGADEYVDTDSDVIPDYRDNCPATSNESQEDNYPPQGNGIGDACDCESDFLCDGDVDADDVTAFLTDFGRGQYFQPCTNENPCHGDASCDSDVDADDVTKFLEDFGRGQYFNPCPTCVVGDWCSY